MNRRRGTSISRKRSKAALIQWVAAMAPERRVLLRREDLERSWNVPPREIDELLASFERRLV